MADSNSKEEQARNAQAHAEKCFLAGNVLGAKRWMQSAIRLAPDLPGNTQIVAAYDVHATAARRPLDWYAVLGLPNPSSAGSGVVLTHDAIKKQYRRLCLLVHPDKNHSVAANGAFKLVQAAWDALSARHPPGMTAVAAAAKQPPPSPPRQPAPPRPPDPPRQPQPRPRPQVEKMSWRAAAPTTSCSQQTTRVQEPQKGRYVPPPRARRPPSPPAGKCPSCGARAPTLYNWNFRCMDCHWDPMDSRLLEEDDDDDDFFEYDY
ncbi:uncharacterized protein LOC133917816 [Phragmites australis]|uniref:uncharacterized protein LOC133917816 n=1 Tax=Phragmites australis TaxID=29695 RepID=UPI002D785229|nr:uncharacterized protein LOC133917816 [Phragmites australis]